MNPMPKPSSIYQGILSYVDSVEYKTFHFGISGLQGLNPDLEQLLSHPELNSVMK
jgi:hypothetical protein